jgi:hypothetical protein
MQTSLDKTGSDAMNAAGDYSAAYAILHTDGEFQGHGMVCTRGVGFLYVLVSGLSFFSRVYFIFSSPPFIYVLTLLLWFPI